MSVEYRVFIRRGNVELRSHNVNAKFHVAPCGRFAVYVEMEKFNYRTAVLDLVFGRKFELNDWTPGYRYRQVVGIMDDFSAIAVMALQYYEAVSIDLNTKRLTHLQGICQTHNHPMSPQTINDGRFLMVYQPPMGINIVRHLQIIELSTLQHQMSKICKTDAGVPLAARVTTTGRLLAIGEHFAFKMSLMDSPLLTEASENNERVRNIPLVGKGWAGLLARQTLFDFLDDEHFVGVQRLHPYSLFVGRIRFSDVELLGIRHLNLWGSPESRVRSVSCNNGVTYVSYARWRFQINRGAGIHRLDLRRPLSLLLSAHFAALTSGRKFVLPQQELIETLPQFGSNPYRITSENPSKLNRQSRFLQVGSSTRLLIKPSEI